VAFLLDARPAAIRRLEAPEADRAAAAEMLRTYAEACWETALRAPGIAGRLRTARSEARTPVV
jgi:hypothetical protein